MLYYPLRTNICVPCSMIFLLFGLHMMFSVIISVCILYAVGDPDYLWIFMYFPIGFMCCIMSYATHGMNLRKSRIGRYIDDIYC
jgi:hypothetical protein